MPLTRIPLRLVGAACIALSLAGGAAAANIRKEFAAIWSAREKDYVASQQAAAEVEKSRSASFLEIAKSNATSDTLVPSFQTALSATRQSSFETSRLKLLQEFEAFMATKPSGAAAQAWLQGKVAQIQAALPAGPVEEERLRKVRIGIDEPVGQWIAEKGKAASFEGMIQGLTSELTLIDQNLRAFYVGLGEQEAAARERWARISAALMATGQALQAQAANAQAQAPRPFSMTCSRLGNFTNCSGSR